MRLTGIVITGGLLAALAASPGAADDLQRDRPDIGHDRREIREDRADLRNNVRDLRHDRRDRADRRAWPPVGSAPPGWATFERPA